MTDMHCCLIVDDEPAILSTLSRGLESMAPPLKCMTAETLEQARRCLKEQSIDICLTDMRLPDGNGLELVQHIQQHYPNIPVAMITAHGSIESAIKALKSGAFDFITKPVQLSNLRNIVKNALRLSSKPSSEQPNMIGDSKPMETLRNKIQKLARSQAPAYISGESGTGKELVARMIHAQGSRADKPFVPVNCGAIPQELMESEFFGHKKGSFTGAITDKVGLFQAAQSGTLFLDEIADLPLDMQVKLLRAIQEKRIRPVGSHQEINVDARILSATHKDLAKLVNHGKFRQDLFYRINVIEVCVPPLRERHEDIPDLVAHILTRLSHNTTVSNMSKQPIVPELSREAINALKNYNFPGNVRELENILERAMTLCEGNRIVTDDLQLPSSSVSEQQNSQQAALARHSPASLNPLLDNIEKETILQALEQTEWNKTRAAKLLGVGHGALRYRLKKLDLEKPPDT